MRAASRRPRCSISSSRRGSSRRRDREARGRPGEHSGLRGYDGLRPGSAIYSADCRSRSSSVPAHGTIYDGVQRRSRSSATPPGAATSRRESTSPLSIARKSGPSRPPSRGAKVSERNDRHDARNRLVLHRVLVPPTSRAPSSGAPAGSYAIDEVIARVIAESGKEIPLALYHRWPVRKGRPYRERIPLASAHHGQRSSIPSSPRRRAAPSSCREDSAPGRR